MKDKNLLKQTAKKTPRFMAGERKKDHLFNPHTDRCIFCGISADDDAVEGGGCVVATEKRIKRAPNFEEDEPSRDKRKCKHVPHDPDTMQTVCELCGAEIEPKDRGSSNVWVTIKESNPLNAVVDELVEGKPTKCPSDVGVML